MKVVLFCGGLGLRMRPSAPNVPMPLIELGGRPILWHIMRWYAHFGHNDFVLCLGHRGELIKRFFGVPPSRCRHQVLETDDWRITFLQTPFRATVGERLAAARPFVAGEELFLANYSDVLTDAPLPDLVETIARRGKTALLLSVRPRQTFHALELGEDGLVSGLVEANASQMRINGGYFVFRQGVFDALRAGEDLVGRPLQRLAERGELLAWPHDGFWAPMDTLKDREELEDLWRSHRSPWSFWDQPGSERAVRVA